MVGETGVPGYPEFVQTVLLDQVPAAEVARAKEVVGVEFPAVAS